MDTPMLVGLASWSRTDRNTVAELLKSHGFMRYAFRSPIKRGATAMFGLTPSQLDGPEKEVAVALVGKTPREILRKLGDFMRDQFGPEVLLRLAEPVIQGAQLCKKPLVMTDIYTEHESNFIRQNAGAVVHLLRREAPPERRLWMQSPVAVDHRDVVILSDGIAAELRSEVQDRLELLPVEQKGSRKIA